MYLVKAIKFFSDSQAPTVEESFRKPGVQFEVGKERLDLLLSMGLVEIVEKPRVEKVEEEIIEPKEEEIVITKSNNGGRKHGRKSVNMARKNC